MEAAPRVIIIAGPNGAGKTMFAREFLPSEAACPVFVNADLIAAGLAPFAPTPVFPLKRRFRVGVICAKLANGKKLDIALSLFFCN